MTTTLGGGIPHVVRDTFDTTGRRVKLPFFTSYMIVRNKGSNVARLYFTEADYTDDVNYVEIPVAAATDPHGEWQGPVETAHDKYSDVFLRGVGGSADIELVAFQRRG
jgi:hypothetical protein